MVGETGRTPFCLGAEERVEKGTRFESHAREEKKREVT